MKQVNESIICAGFGGQGIMILGKVLAEAGMMAGFHVTWLPSYGAEVRGGTAHSVIKISTEPIGSPYVSNADVAIVMNGPSLGKFEKRVKEGGILILNTSMASDSPKRKDIKVIKVPLTDEAIDLGNVKVANMIAAGVLSGVKEVFSEEVLDEVIKKMAGKKEELIPINIKAVKKGIELASQEAGKK